MVKFSSALGGGDNAIFVELEDWFVGLDGNGYWTLFELGFQGVRRVGCYVFKALNCDKFLGSICNTRSFLSSVWVVCLSLNWS